MIDCHAHLASPDFDADREAVCRRAAEAGVAAVLVVGEHAKDNARVLRVTAGAEPNGCALLPCLGFHPDRFADDRRLPTRPEIDAAIAQIREYAGNLAAIGEVGLDYWVVKDPERRRAQGGLLEEMAEVSLAGPFASWMTSPSRDTVRPKPYRWSAACTAMVTSACGPDTSPTVGEEIVTVGNQRSTGSCEEYGKSSRALG